MFIIAVVALLIMEHSFSNKADAASMSLTLRDILLPEGRQTRLTLPHRLVCNKVP